MARQKTNYPLDDLKACIGLLESAGFNDFLYNWRVKPMLEDLGEKVDKENCLEELKKLLDKLKDEFNVDLKFTQLHD
jgi:hypothetical protein